MRRVDGREFEGTIISFVLRPPISILQKNEIYKNVNTPIYMHLLKKIILPISLSAIFYNLEIVEIMNNYDFIIFYIFIIELIIFVLIT